MSEHIGWLICLYEHGRWTDTWDGTIHVDRAEAEASLQEAIDAGYEVRLGSLILEAAQ